MVNHFLQSKEWEEFQKSMGREVFRIDGALVMKLPLAFGKSYFYCGGCLPFNIKQVSDLAKKENVIFLKLEPMGESREVSDVLKRRGFVRSEKEIQPQKTIILDITKQDDELLAQMHQKSRYNIRLCARKGVKIQPPGGGQNSDIFWQLLQKTSERDGFSIHTREYYERLSTLPIAQLFTAEYRGETIAANIILFYGDTAYYLHGASDYKYRRLMAPYLLHWETIKYAKKNDFATYDFWGIDEKKWPGVTRFKRGFGGREVEYIGSYDYIFKPFLYKLYRFRGLVSTFTKKLKAKS